MIASAPRVCAFATKRSAVTGTNIKERQVGCGRFVMLFQPSYFKPTYFKPTGTTLIEFCGLPSITRSV